MLHTERAVAHEDHFEPPQGPPSVMETECQSGIIIDGTPATHQQEVAHIGEKEKSNPETAANDRPETEGSPTCSTPGERNKNGQRSSGKRKFKTTKETPL